MGLDVMSPFHPGEVVYIQEAWAYAYECEHYNHLHSLNQHILYAVTHDACGPHRWRSPITMPEKHSRSKARIVSVGVERVREITHEEAIAEGVAFMPEAEPRDEALSVSQIVFAGYWDTLYPGSWNRNDWVWRYGLEVEPCS